MNAIGLLWLGGIVERRLGSAAFAAIVAAGATASVLRGCCWDHTCRQGASSSERPAWSLVYLRQHSCTPFAGNLRKASEGDRRLRRPLLICFIAVTGISCAGRQPRRSSRRLHRRRVDGIDVHLEILSRWKSGRRFQVVSVLVAKCGPIAPDGPSWGRPTESVNTFPSGRHYLIRPSVWRWRAPPGRSRCCR
jgi:hypothetical protein